MTTRKRRRLPGSVLLRLADRQRPFARRVLLAIVADLQFEWREAGSATGRLLARLRGTCAFARAMAPFLAGGLGRDLQRVAWGASPEDQAAGRSLLSFVAIATTVASAIVLATSGRPSLRLLPAQEALGLLLPGVLCATLPPGCLLGVLMAGGRTQADSGIRWRPLLATAGLAALATFVLAGWWTPRSNQEFRQRVFTLLNPEAAARGLSPGDRELTFVDLDARIAESRLRGETASTERLSVEWHKKPALAVSCIAMALVALAVRRARRLLVRVALGWAAIGVWGVLLRFGEQAADAGRIGPVLAMWGPVAVLLALGLLVALRGRVRRPTLAS